jgi:hypothetical protein
MTEQEIVASMAGSPDVCWYRGVSTVVLTHRKVFQLCSQKVNVQRNSKTHSDL